MRGNDKIKCYQVPAVKEVILKIDASFGVEVAVGDEVEAGEFLGFDAKTGGKVFSPMDGVVAECSFDSGSHEFRISVKSVKS